MKPKVWLVENGHKPAGYENTKGKIDRVAKELIIEAVHNGAKIDGYELTPSTGPVEAAPTVEKVKASNEKEIKELTPYRFPLNEYEAWETRNGKEVWRSLRCVCGHCSHSLVVCWCPNPEIVAHDGGGWVPVKIRPIRKVGGVPS